MELSLFFSALLGSLVTGSLIGAIPAIYGAIEGKLGLAITAFLACRVSAIILGLILAIPCCALFLFIIFKKSRKQS